MKTHKDLDVYKFAMDFVTEIYRETRTFPKEEIYGLTSQMRRAAVSIPSNIAEGSARKNFGENKQFLHVSLGSASELETQIVISKNLGFLSNDTARFLIEKLNTISRMIQGLIKYITQSQVTNH